MIYLDTSAIVKLLRREAETAALVDHLDAHSQHELITSALSTVEAARALRAVDAEETASRSIRSSHRIEIDGGIILAVAVSGPVLDLARTLPPAVLRSLDAIHVATAKLAGGSLDHLITYDKRMILACEAAGLRGVSPT